MALAGFLIHAFCLWRSRVFVTTALLMTSLICLLSDVTSAAPTYTQIQYLFRVSQGANAQYPPGLWGGEMDHSGDGIGSDLFKYGYNASVSQSVTSERVSQSLSIHSVSFDEATQEAMMVLDDGVLQRSGASTSSYTAVAVSLCKPDEGKIRLLFTQAILQHPDHPYLFDADCSSKCGWGPFAYHDGKVYFILSAVFGNVPALLTRRIELRQLVPCGDEGGDVIEQSLEEFNLLECSRPLALLFSEPYKKPTPQVKVWPAHSLKAAKIAGEDVFFLQLLDTSTGESMLQLVAAKPESNVTQTLYTCNIEDRYTSSAYVQGFASVDYRDGFLCWTAADSLMCAFYSNQYGLDHTNVLAPGEAVNHSVCTGSMPTPELQRALTGVAIAETGESLAVYFGCYAEIPGVGGVGLVRITNHGVVKEVVPIKSGNHKVFGGAVFLTNTVDNDCAIATQPSSSPLTSTVLPVPTVSNAPVLGPSLCLMLLLSLLLR